jgi:hypothetical protein
MNEAKQKHNESTFLRTKGDVFILCEQDIHHDTRLQSFQLQNDSNFTKGLHLEVQIKKNMLVEFCARNYARHDDLVNSVDGIFQGSTKVFNHYYQNGVQFISLNHYETLKVKSFIAFY